MGYERTYEEEGKDDTPHKDPFGNIKPYRHSTIISTFPSDSGGPLFISDLRDRPLRLQEEKKERAEGEGDEKGGRRGEEKKEEKRTCSDEIIVTATKISNP
jgi:hypothetical protein